MDFFAVTILLALVSCSVDAQIQSNLSTYGSEFFVGFYEHVHTANTHIFYVHTMKTTAVSFTVTSLDGSFSYSGTTTYLAPASVSIPYSYEVRGNSYSWRKKGLRISSLETNPISVIGWSYRSAADYMSYLALPCHKQPTTEYTYYVVSTLGWSNQMSQFLIIGCIDNTSVTIIPSNTITVPSDPQSNTASSINISPGDSYNFTLHSLETLFIYKPYVDLTGTRVISDQPLTIISGHEASRVPQDVYDADPIVTQLSPTITWGKTFLLAPHNGRTNGQSFKVIAAYNDTTATRTCGPAATVVNITFDKNNTNWFFTTQNVYCSIQSDKPIYVAQIGVSQAYDGGSVGDPSLSIVPPIDQYDNEAQITAFSQATGYYSVVVPNDIYYTGSLRINGYLQNVSFTSIYNSSGSVIGYGYTSATSGSSYIAHPASKGSLFVSVYGWTTYGGYSYSGGMKLNPINIENPLPEITFTAIGYTVNEGDGMVYVYIERMKEFDSNVSVRVFTNPTPEDTATGLQDYSSIDVTVDFNDGETIKNVSIPIIDDPYTESTQYFTLSIERSTANDDVVFPITETVISIIDNDDIKIGFNSDQFTIESGNLTTITVQLLNGSLEPGLSIPFTLRISIADGDNSTDMSCELSSFNPWSSFGFDLTQLSSYTPNVTQTINTELWLSNDAPQVNVTVSPSTVSIVPVIPIVPPSSIMITSSSMTSSIACMTSSAVPTSSITIPTSTITSSITVTQTLTSTSSVCPSPTIPFPSVSSTANIFTSTIVSTSTVVSTTTSISISTVTSCSSSISRGNVSTPTPTKEPRVNVLSESIQVPGGAIYFGTAGFVVAIIVVLIFSFFCCCFCYRRGHHVGQKLEIKLERDIEMSGNNPLYESVADMDNVSYRSSIGDEKKLLQFIQ